MSSIDLKRPVAVNVIMTEEFRKQLIDEANTTIAKIDENLKLLDTESKKKISALDLTNPQQASLMTQQYETEKERLMKLRGELAWKIKEVENVQDGAELPFRIFEGSVELKVGDNFLDKISKAEIIIKDWQIVEIRQA
ncbi:MAG: YlqD family protein [Firmicutes bacterium]|nr:YlqD family protein [Bacillota bacterium]